MTSDSFFDGRLSAASIKWTFLIIATLLFLLCIASPQSRAEATAALDGQEDVVATVKADRSVQAEIARVRSNIHARESTPEEIKVVELGSGCGVVGCGASYLAVITIRRMGTNPQSASVLAMVRRSPRGKLGRVTVVELKEKGLKETKLEVQRRYSSPLSVIKRK